MTRTKKIILSMVFALVLVGILFVAGLSLNVYREMMKINTGTLWHLPTRIYSSPFEFRPGIDIRETGLAGRLTHLGYRNSIAAESPGQYCLLRTSITIYLHPFEYPEGPQKAQKVRVILDGNRIKALAPEKTEAGMASARLEPECIATLYDAGFEDREIIKLKDCPRHLIDALLCVEDRRFYDHSGIDIRSMARALLADMFHAHVVEGGSTITQQLAKNLFLTHERTVSRKIKEIWLSAIMETVFTKDEILSMYMNEIYLGRFGSAGIHGFGRASKIFFDKDVSDLDLHEAALLVGLVRAPNTYSPYSHPKTALERRNTVLAMMREQGKITDAQYDTAVHKPLSIVPFTPSMKQAPFFIDHILSSVRMLYPDEDILTKGGLHLFTTLDMNMQHTTEDIVAGGAAGLAKNIQIASVIINPATGAILAMVGGRDYGASQFNRVTSIRRNIGSLIKPIIYYCALKNGYTLASVLDDSPLTVKLENKTAWSPANYDKISHGNILLLDALAHSYNLATVRLGLTLGLDHVIPEVRSVLPRTALLKQPSLLLGAINCSPLDVAGMYSVFAGGGLRIEPWCLETIVDEHGAVLWKDQHKDPQKVLDPGPIYLLNTALQEAIRSGTAKAAKSFGVPDGICGKTGTTNEMKDSWFAAYTQDMVIVVWLGDDAFRAIGFTGATGAMPFAARIIARIAEPRPWGTPDDITFCAIDPANGKRATNWTAAAVTLPFIKGTEPNEVSEEGMPGLWKVLKHIFPFGK
ncbi:MAG: PBP1A family penicillin-binding protein [Desulfomonilia bacterium]